MANHSNIVSVEELNAILDVVPAALLDLTDDCKLGDDRNFELPPFSAPGDLMDLDVSQGMSVVPNSPIAVDPFPQHQPPVTGQDFDDDCYILNLFPQGILRAEKNEYEAHKAECAYLLSSRQIERLKALRRKERSCVYAEKTRQRRIGKAKQQAKEVEKLQALVARLKSENGRLCQENEELRNRLHTPSAA